MIYTTTFNPALDYIVNFNNFQMGMTNRTEQETLLPGGKGINVSMMLHNLGVESTALGFIAGFTGEEIKRRVEICGCKTNFITIANGLSRINIKLLDSDGTEINGRGPDIDQKSLEKLLCSLDSLQEDDILVLAGSIPSSLPDTIYQDICERLQKKGLKIVVDATKDLLVNVLPLHPFLIKPNHHELGEIFEVQLKTQEDVIPYAKKMQEMGAVNVLVSMAGAGAVLAAEDGKIYALPAPKGRLVNGVGAGDSMVAGFLAGYQQNKNCEQAFRMGVATGSASAFSQVLATKEDVEKLLNQMEETEE
ncbi:MAG TPA: 1-phosphofructokinase [Lachnospiraceae bacterium]|nr:1-phosphofructokinase [Lachnospiraceae bacterium]